MLCLLLTGSQMHSVDFEGSRLAPKEEFVRSLSTRAHEWLYEKEIAARKSKLEADRQTRAEADRQAPIKAADAAARNSTTETKTLKDLKLMVLQNSDFENLVSLDIKNLSTFFQDLTNIQKTNILDDILAEKFRSLSIDMQYKLMTSIPWMKIIEKIRKSKTAEVLTSAQYEIKKQEIAPKDKIQLDQETDFETLSNNHTAALKNIQTRAEADVKKQTISEKNNTSLSDLKKEGLSDSEYRNKELALMYKIGTNVDPNFKPYNPKNLINILDGTLYQNIMDHIQADRLNYQARLNQLHKDKYNPAIKLTPNQKLMLMKEIIPSISRLNVSTQENTISYLQEQIINQLTDTMN